MFNSRYLAAVAFVVLLAPAGIPFVNAQVSLDDVLPPGVWPSVPTDNAVCDEYAGTCGGAADAVDDVPGLHVDPADPEHAVEDVRHLVADHAVAGACADAADACDTSPETPPMPTTVAITTPENGNGSKPGESVRITWTVHVIDPLGLFYRVETRSNAQGADWTTDGIVSDGCNTAPQSVGGTCSALWMPPGPGTYAIRVVHIGQLANDSICDLAVNCAVVSPYYVDDVAPTVSGISVTPVGEDGKIDSLQATFSAIDARDVNLETVEFVVSAGNFRTQSCSYNVTQESCSVDISSFLTKVYSNPDVHQGSIDVVVTVKDTVGNFASLPPQTFEVDTAGNEVVQVQPLSTIPTLVRNTETVGLTYKVVSVLPASMNNAPKVGAAFELRDESNALVCSKTVPANGIVACPVAHTDVMKTYTAAILPNAEYDVLSYTSATTWTALNVERLQLSDLPQTSLHVNVAEVYSSAFRVTTTWDNEPVSGAFVQLAESSELTDAAGFVRVPLVRGTTTVETAFTNATYQVLKYAGPSVDLVWTTVDLSAVTLDDAFVNVGDVVTFTGATAVYNHDTNQLVENANLALADNGQEGCSVTGTITNGVVAGTAVCDVVFDGALPLKIVDSTRGITSFTSDVLLSGIWTNIEITNVDFDNFVNIDDIITVTGDVAFAHSAKPAVAEAVLDLITPVDGCTLLDANVVAGDLTARLMCSQLSSAAGTDFAFEVTSAENDVTQLAAAFELNAVWTNVVVSIDAYDNFVNVEDTVSLIGTAVWEHDNANVANGAFGFAESQSDCTLLTGSIVDGVVTVDVACTTLSAASGTQLGLVVVSSSEDVTNLSAAFVLDAVWTTIDVGAPAFDAIVNVTSDVTFVATATYAHDGSAVVAAAVEFANPVADCLMAEGSEIANGVLTVTVACSAVSSAAGTDFPVIVASGDEGVVNLTTPLTLTSTWTQIVITNPFIEDNFVNRNDTVTMTATAKWAHDDTNVAEGALEFGSTVEGCTLVTGTIVDGAVTVAVECVENSGATGTTIPLVVASATDDVLALAADLSLTATWTQVIVSYETDATSYTQATNAVVKFTANVVYAHDGSNVKNAVVSVASSDGTFRCLTQPSGSCFARATRDLGTSHFEVSAYSTKAGNLFNADITSMTNVQEGVEYRWTAIGFDAFSCAVLVDDVFGAEGSCDQTFATGSIVRVFAKAVEADTRVELEGASVELDGYDLVTDEDGRVFVDVPGFADGPVNVAARGTSATIAGETVTATIPAEVVLNFA